MNEWENERCYIFTANTEKKTFKRTYVRVQKHTYTHTQYIIEWIVFWRPWNNNDNKCRTNMIRETDNLVKQGFNGYSTKAEKNLSIFLSLFYNINK